MRSAALIFGLLAGLMGGIVIALGNVESGLAAARELGNHRESLAKFIVYTIPNIGLLGAGLALARPRLGSVLLLLSAAGWAGAAIVAGHGAVLFAALPFTFAAAGGLVALFGRRGPELLDAPEVNERPRLARHWPDERPLIKSPVAPAASSSRTRPPVLRNEPDFTRQAPRQEPIAAPAPEPRADEPPARAYRTDEYPVDEYPDDGYPPEDYVDAVESFDEDDREAADAPLHDANRPLREANHSAIEDIYGAAGVEPPVSPPRRQGHWSLPETKPPPSEPAPPPSPRYAAERQPLPQKRQPLPPLEEPPQRRRPLPPLAESPRRRWPSIRRRNPRALLDTDQDVAEFEPEDLPDGLPPPRDNALRGFLQVVILGLFIVVVIGIGVAVYIDFGRGSQSVLFGSRPHVVRSAATAPAPAAEQSHARSGALVLEQPTAAAATEPLPPMPLADAGTAPRLSAADTPSGAGPVTAGGVLFSDPFRYCQAIGTIDAPDAEYNGPDVPPAIATALGLAPSTPGNEVHWRCVDRTVMACTSQGAACAPTPTVEVMLGYCAAHPDTQNIAAPNGSWSCNGTRPVIPRDQKWPVDARGFYPNAWQQVAQPQGG